MKKILFIVLIFFTSRAYSQTISYGIIGGATYTQLPGTQTLNYGLSDKYITGFQAGGFMDIGFKKFSIQPSILFTSTGGQGKVYFNNTANSGVTDYVNNKIVLDYFKLPINLVYKIKAGAGHIFIGGGPYVAFGTSGKISYATNKPYGTQNSVTFGNDKADAKNPEFGINGILGYKFKPGVALSAGYSLALTDTYSSGANNKNKGFNISVEYFF